MDSCCKDRHLARLRSSEIKRFCNIYEQFDEVFYSVIDA